MKLLVAQVNASPAESWSVERTLPQHTSDT